MPTYRNTTDAPITPPGQKTVPAGAVFTTIGDVYIDTSIPALAGLELVSHSPRSKTPVKLFSGTLPSGTISDLPAYSSIQLLNKSGNDITVAFNGDSQNGLIYPDGTFLQIELEAAFYSMAVTGSGAGSVHVWGLK